MDRCSKILLSRLIIILLSVLVLYTVGMYQLTEYIEEIEEPVSTQCSLSQDMVFS